jgi:hypothetical protein
MSYELADGSMSTDYKIGDEFYVIRGSDEGKIAIFLEDDGSELPWFDKGEEGRSCELWGNLQHFKTKKNTTLINQLHETIRQLKATIKELER